MADRISELAEIPNLGSNNEILCLSVEVLCIKVNRRTLCISQHRV